MVLVVKGLLFDEGQDERPPTMIDGVCDIGLGEGPSHLTWRKLAARVVEVVQGQAELLQVVLALDATGGFAHLLHRGQQQPDQDGDNADHHQ